jgi:hypothetical protein
MTEIIIAATLLLRALRRAVRGEDQIAVMFAA